MIEYIKASKEDKADIIDFINYVFSHDHEPHDFKTLLPKAYSDEVDGLGAVHYAVKEDGKIKAVVANRIIDTDYCGNMLKIGMIGSVSVHPYSRGRGFMTKLMEMAIGDAKKMGVQMLMLSGRRQRYGHFGFENGGIVYNFTVTADNVRRVLGDVDDSEFSYKEMTKERPDEIRLACALNNSQPCHTLRSEDEFMRIMNSWSEKSYVIYKKGEMAGYSFGMCRELVLKDEKDYPKVIKAMVKNVKTAYIPAGAYERRKIDFLTSVCERYSIAGLEMVCVLDWKAVISALFKLKSETVALCDGEKTFVIDGECITVSVKNNEVKVTDALPGGDARELSHNMAEKTFFELDGLLNNNDFGNWFPLPLYISSADTF